jgi:diguanylate cyclase (GGDEF)-like protein
MELNASVCRGRCVADKALAMFVCTVTGDRIFAVLSPAQKKETHNNMAEGRKDRRRNSGEHHSDDLSQCTLPESRVKEYSYVLRILPEDLAILEKHREALVAGTAGFAEAYYKCLFDNPDIAEVLYSHERNGGDVGALVRAELANMLGSIVVVPNTGRETDLVKAGGALRGYGFRPVWVIASYNLLIDFINDFLPSLEINTAEKHTLRSVITRQLLRDMGLTIEGFWRAVHDGFHQEKWLFEKERGIVENLLSGIPHYLWSVDIKNNSVVYANSSLHSLYAGELEAPVPCLTDTSEEDQQRLLTAWQTAVNGTRAYAEVRMLLAGGERHWYRVSMFPSVECTGQEPELVHCILEDIHHLISERKLLERLATTDRLTQLPNRALWTDHLNMALAASRRAPGSQVVVISIDINQFKMYNDTLGRDVGDILLRDVAERLDSIVRESDSLARLGGDQFGILLQPVNNARVATERVITQILDSFDMPFSSPGKQLCVSLTMGIACFPEDGTNEETLLTNAESAMHRAKRNGLPYQYFDPLNDVSPEDQLRYSGQIRAALDNSEFLLHYQPQVDIQTSRITGVEALLRWEHPLEGTVMPQRIIPVAEQLGMITPITDWVLVTALKQCKQWTYDGMHIPVAVNVSARSFQNPRLLEKIQWALEVAEVGGEYLEIEITEAILMQDLDRATKVLNRLSETGVTIAIDDFGTGYSSLSYLKQLPIHTLKIDQSFIMDVAFDQQDVAIVRSVIDLGHNLGYKVVAEGVENGMAWDILSNLGCDTAQGFHISKPLADNHFSNWLAASGRTA